MATSRTGSTKYLRWVAQVKHRAQRSGVTHCPLCRVWLDYNRGRRPNSAEADHIEAHASGGQETLDNGRVICRRCNGKLGGKLGNKRKQAKLGKAPQRVQNINFRD